MPHRAVLGFGRLAALATFGLLTCPLLSCKVELAVPTGAQLSCTGTSQCPGGFVCHAQRCAPAGDVDTTPPDLAGPLRISPPLARALQVVTIALDASEPLAEPPRLRLGLDPPEEVPCSATSETAFTCSYTATGDEYGGAGGVVGVDVWLRDEGRNETTRRLAGSFRLDFAAPEVATAAAVYLPFEGSPLPSVTRAAAGTVVEVAVTADEPLDPADPPALSAGLGGATLPFALDAGRLGATTAVFQAVVPADAPDGDYAATVTWSDLAGNRDGRAVPAVVVRVKTSRPALAVDQAEVTFLRSPWGNAASEDLGGFVLPAGPYFALAPGDPLSASATLPASTFSAPGATPALLRVWADAGAQSLLGSARPRDDGAWPRVRLANLDTPWAWVTLVDDAGNESAPARLQNVEWVATASPPAWGTSPHAVDASVYLVEALVPAADVAVPVAGLEGLDGTTAVVRAQGTFRAAGGATPGARRATALVHDTARDHLVLHGGYAEDGTILGDTWVFDGQRWRSSSPDPSPGPRFGHGMAYDAARGRTVLYGGRDALGGRTDTWEWDGATWHQVGGGEPNPGQRYSGAMAWDAARRRTVVFGGSTDPAVQWTTWAWDGAAWTKLAIPDLPPERINTAMAYDPGRGAVVLFAGSNPRGASYLGDVHELRDDGWHDVTPAAGAAQPSARYGHAFAWDPVRRRLVAFGGQTEVGRTSEAWAWDGAGWEGPLPSTGPAARSMHAMAAARGRLWVMGGVDDGYVTLGDLWTLDGFGAWFEVTGGPTPPARAGHVMAYDPTRGRVVMAGGEYRSDVWEWNGARWFDVTPAAGAPTPGSPVDAAMAWDPVEQRVVITGGWSGTGDLVDAWDWDGAAWRRRTLAAGSPVPGFSAGPGLAHDPLRARLVLWGLFGSNAVWELSGPPGGPWTWSSAAPASTPTWRGGVSLLHDGQRLVAAFGDGGWNGHHAELWTWSGVEWAPIASGVAPGARAWQHLAWDEARGVALLFGGVPDGGAPFGDVWTWDGAAFARVEPPPGAEWPSARSHGAMAYDSARGRMVLFGGTEEATEANAFDPGHRGSADTRTWEWDVDAAPSAAGPVQRRAPMVQLTASLLTSGFTSAQATGLRVRARAGGTFGAGTGARLLGWKSAGGWEELVSGTAGSPLPAAPAGALTWTAPAGTVQDHLVGEAGAQLAFQLRPAGAPGVADPEAVVEADYLEVRVRYEAP